jgi:hypothetical protein
VKHFSGAPLYGRLLGSPTNIRLGWKGLPRTNALAYSATVVSYERKMFMKFPPELLADVVEVDILQDDIFLVAML